jgi:SagB-type dehydrogenase family enzyme
MLRITLAALEFDKGDARPLAQRLPRRRDGALVFEVGDREVRVEGDLEGAWRALELCDGTRTVGMIAAAVRGDDGDIRELLQRLLAEGAVVDCAEGYRLLHDHGSSRSGLFRAVDPEALTALAAEPVRPVRLAREKVALDSPPERLAGLLARRRSADAGEAHRVSTAELSAIVAAIGGRVGEGAALPSAGALRPLLVQVVLRRPLDGMGPGVWWHDAERGELRLVEPASIPVERLLLSPGAVETIAAAGEPVIFVSADARRMARKYANRGYRYALLEAGAAMQNAYLAAAELGVPIRAVGGFDDDAVGAALALPPGALALLALTLGG